MGNIAEWEISMSQKCHRTPEAITEQSNKEETRENSREVNGGISIALRLVLAGTGQYD